MSSKEEAMEAEVPEYAEETSKEETDLDNNGEMSPLKK